MMDPFFLGFQHIIMDTFWELYPHRGSKMEDFPQNDPPGYLFAIR